MHICFSNINPVYNVKAAQIKSSANPVQLFKMMKMYSKERNEHFPNIQAVLNSLNSILTNCRMRIVKDKSGNLLVAYTYKLRKNRLDEKSMYIDALVRNRSNEQSKTLMKEVYKDMKNIALNKHAEELTLYSVAKESALRSNYEKLGFKKDETVWIKGGYIMRVRINNFLNGLKL